MAHGSALFAREGRRIDGGGEFWGDGLRVGRNAGSGAGFAAGSLGGRTGTGRGLLHAALLSGPILRLTSWQNERTTTGLTLKAADSDGEFWLFHFPTPVLQALGAPMISPSWFACGGLRRSARICSRGQSLQGGRCPVHSETAWMPAVPR